jgi:hypothetical protein
MQSYSRICETHVQVTGAGGALIAGHAQLLQPEKSRRILQWSSGAHGPHHRRWPHHTRSAATIATKTQTRAPSLARTCAAVHHGSESKRRGAQIGTPPPTAGRWDGPTHTQTHVWPPRPTCLHDQRNRAAQRYIIIHIQSHHPHAEYMYTVGCCLRLLPRPTHAHDLAGPVRV